MLGTYHCREHQASELIGYQLLTVERYIKYSRRATMVTLKESTSRTGPSLHTRYKLFCSSDALHPFCLYVRINFRLDQHITFFEDGEFVSHLWLCRLHVSLLRL